MVRKSANSGLYIQLSIKEILLILGLIGHGYNSYLAHQRQELLFTEIISIKNEMLKQLPALSAQIKGVVSELDLQNSIPKITSSVKDFGVSKTNLGGLVDQIPSVLKEPSSTYSLLDSINQIISHPVFLTFLGIGAVFYSFSTLTNKISLGVSEFLKPESETFRERILKDHPIVMTPNSDNLSSSPLPEINSTVIPSFVKVPDKINCLDFPELSSEVISEISKAILD